MTPCRVMRLDARFRRAWRSYLWRTRSTDRARWTLQVARQPGEYLLGVAVRPDISHLSVTANLGPLTVTVGWAPR